MSTPEDQPHVDHTLPHELPEDVVDEVEEAEGEPHPEHPIVLPEEPPPAPSGEEPPLEVTHPIVLPPEGTEPIPPAPEEPAPEPMPEPVPVDAAKTLALIVKDAQRRCEKMTAAHQEGKRKEDPGGGFACAVARISTTRAEDALQAIVDAAVTWDAGFAGGDVARRHTLASRIIRGAYNVPETGEQPPTATQLPA